MYKLLSQLFLSVIGQNLPEEVFEDNLYWLLQGSRKNRQIIDLNVRQFSITTPHQLEIIGWPIEYIGAQTSKGVNKIYSILRCSMFRKLFHTRIETVNPSTNDDCPYIEHDFRPCYRYVDQFNSDGIHRVRTILHFTTRKALEGTKRLISLHGQRRQDFQGKIVCYKLETKDRSHMSCCYFCTKFMPCLSERLNMNKKDFDEFESLRRSFSSFSDKLDWNSYLCNIPICVECVNSKERQGKYRMNMFHHRAFRYLEYTNPLSSVERREYNIRHSMDTEKPDMRNIPIIDNYGDYKTPLDYSGSYSNLINKYSAFYWHPEITADEYMRLQVYYMMKVLENSDPLDEEHYPEDDLGDDLYDDYDDI